MIRITGGRFKGRQLKSVASNAVRPTTARVRESLFSILGHKADGARFLDLFAGAGGMGIEALSRGVSQVVAVELNATHRKVIEKNIELLKITPAEYQLVGADAFEWPKQAGKAKVPPFDIVFCDPPFALPDIEVIVERVFEAGLVKPTGCFIWEFPYRYKPREIEGLELFDVRQYGDSGIHFYRLPQPVEQPA